ncbi:phospholipase D family protein [Stenotrophomonas sp. YIM B06876]|uniref:phospholipase D family protein n=1 Tax=Stenotrophomonas sp. YIM B06876 TaxID=3060211 RepID=UPI0027384172|nr:phospholipase D family protein [Stenotrophomonas sp. YIM B06876]
MNATRSRAKRLLRLFGIVLAALLVLVASGLLLADRLTPKALGSASHTLPLQPAQTRIDRELQPLLAAHPGQSGVAYLSDGLDAYAARAVITRYAGRSLDLQYYIWHDDLVGHLLARDLYEAAERGVRVRLLLDDMNAKGLDPMLVALDAHPNIELRLYNPFRNRGGLWRSLEMVQRAFSVNHRMHNKAWIADGRMAIVGGRNIGEEYFDARPDVNFRDLDLLLAGPVVAQASGIFDDYWNSDAAVPITALNRHSAPLQTLLRKAEPEWLLQRARPYLQRVRDQAQARYLEDHIPLHWTAHVEVRSDPPLKHRQADRSDWLVTRLVRELTGTRHKALLISPYFVPGKSGTWAMTQMVADGRQVGVITNSLAANDVAAVHGGYMRYRTSLLRGGVQLYELKAHGGHGKSTLFGSSGASLHTKAFVIDDQRGFVGSFNLDPRSAYLNTEMGVLFDDPTLAAQLRDEYLRLASPALAYRVYLDPRGRVRWLDRGTQPPRSYSVEPETSFMQRALARGISWLPLESQL